MALALYSPCFTGPFVSDDTFAVLNPYVTPLSVGRVVDLFSPYGLTTTMQSEYRPMWFLLHAVERQVFGDSAAAYPAYHVTNVVLHSFVSGLLVLLFLRSGLPLLWALLGGTLFLVQPGNVEAVAWISQLTSEVALALALGALLLAPRRPLAALLCFTVGLLTKPLAVFALPVAALFTWVEQSDDVRGKTRWAWLGAWTVAGVAFAAIDWIAARDKQYGVPFMHPDGVVIARTIIANFSRYLVMATTGYGLSAFQQARPALSWLSPWWLGGVAAFVLLAWRAAHTLAHRRLEGVYWAWALCSFVPISQVVPLIYPMADRYLYFMLPGLIGGALIAAHAVVQRWSRRLEHTMALRLGGGLAVVILLAVFAVQAHQRAGLWISFEELAQDSMRNYPDGIWAHLLRSRIAAQEGDAERSAAEFRAAFEFGNLGTVTADPAYARVLHHPSFQKLFADMADWWITRINAIKDPNQLQLYQLAASYSQRGDYNEAQRALERALAVGGPLNEKVQADLSRLRRRGPS